MELVPGVPEDRVARKESVFIGENAFGFIEPCITKCWPAYKNYGHWGESKIPTETWREIVASLLKLRTDLSDANSPQDVSGLGFIFAEIRRQFHSDFEEMRILIVGMITRLVFWLEERLTSCSYITIVGI